MLIHYLKSKVRLQHKNLKIFLVLIIVPPLITNPTRMSNHSATLIDQVYTNLTPQNMHGDAGILRISISDHYGIFCHKKRSFNNKYKAQFNHCLRNQTWDTIFDSTDMQSAYK